MKEAQPGTTNKRKGENMEDFNDLTTLKGEIGDQLPEWAKILISILFFPIGLIIWFI